MRRPNAIPSAALTVRLPMPLKTRLDLYLFSPLEGRVPHGAHQRLLTQLLEDFLSKVEIPQNDPLG